MVKLASTWPWLAHLVSCLILATARPIKTRFRCGFGCNFLNLATKINSQTHSPRGTPSGIAVRTSFRYSTNPPLALRLLVSLRFQVLFTPLTGVLFTFFSVLVHYRSSSVFSLGEWTPQIPTGLACPVVLRYPARGSTFSRTGLSPSVVGFSTPILLTSHFVTLICWTLQPRTSMLVRFGLFPVRSPLLGEWSLFL